ncbi:MAG TPA: urease accessory protein UreD [Microlunatus sp.]
MRARACVETRLEPADHRGRTRSRLATLRSEPPLILRPIVGNGAEPWVQGDRDAVRIALTAGAAGPVGGDQLDLTVHVGCGSTLVLSEISHTLLLPSHDNATSTTTFHVIVEAGATLIWLPEPIIAAHRCDHINTVDITLAEGARLMVREELLLGRHLEPSGRLRQRTRVTADQQPLFHQDLQLGDQSSRTPAVAANYRAVGSILVVDPAWTTATRPAPLRLTDSAALMPLARNAVLISAVAADSHDLRTALNVGIAALGPPWDPRRPR